MAEERTAHLQLRGQLSNSCGSLARVEAVIVHLDLQPVQAARQLAQRALRWQRLTERPQQPCALPCYVGFLILHACPSPSMSLKMCRERVSES